MCKYELVAFINIHRVGCIEFYNNQSVACTINIYVDKLHYLAEPPLLYYGCQLEILPRTNTRIEFTHATIGGSSKAVLTDSFFFIFFFIARYCCHLYLPNF